MLRVVDLVSGEEMAVFDEPVSQIYSGFDWSPDGRKIAISLRDAPENTVRDLLIVDVRNAKVDASVCLQTAAGGALGWSPDGKQIVMATGQKIHIVNVAGNDKPQLVAGQVGKNSDPAWSPDGKWIVFVSDRKE